MRPLDFLPSIKLKLGVVIVAAVLVTVIVVLAGERAGWPLALTGVAAVLVALALVQGLAHGMTRPLREMVGAARAMSKGDYERRVTASSRDEVGELGRAFNRMAGDLAEVDRVRRDLVANVSHELRTPLGALRAMLENLVDGVETADAETLAAMLQHVERLGSLVEQLLDLSKLESGVVPLDRRPVRARELLDRVARESGPAAQASDVSIELAVEPDSLVLDVDQARVHQVLANLVGNAIRHSPAGGRVVRPREHDEPRRRLRGRGRGTRDRARRARPRVRALLQVRPRALERRRRQRARPVDRALDRRAPRRDDPDRGADAARLQDGRRAAAMRALALAAALFGAAVLPGARLGVAVPLIAALVLGTCLPAATRSAAAAACLVLALALAAQAALLDAGWVVALDLAAAGVAAAVAAGGPRLVALLTPVARLREAPSLLPEASEVSRPVLRGAGLASVVVLPFAVLFLTGDAAFAAIAGELPSPRRRRSLGGP